MPKTTKTIITITATKEGDRVNVSIKAEFKPSAKAKGAMTADQRLAMICMEAMAKETKEKE